MKCESCKIQQAIVVVEVANQSPYHLCSSCQERLINKALRPLEFFNLVTIHGHGHYLHDDFYDYETGESLQPDIEIKDADKYLFPKLEDVINDTEKLVDFACVQFVTTADIIELLQQHKPGNVLKCIDRKIKCNRAINYKVYEIAGSVLGPTASEWIKEEWDSRRSNELLIFSQALVQCLPFEVAFALITTEIERNDDTALNNDILALLHFKNQRVLSWIEHIQGRIKNVSLNWGVLASTSQFSWAIAEKWLMSGRPLSLIALDALRCCTTTEQTENQSSWLRQNQPVLLNTPRPEIIAGTVSRYLQKDNVPRTKNAVNNIINNIFHSN